MFFDKKLKAHRYEGSENVSDLFSREVSKKLGKLIYYYSDKIKQYPAAYKDFENQINIHFNFNRHLSIINEINTLSLRDLFLLIETLSKEKLSCSGGLVLFSEFQEDLNNLFLINKIPFQLIFNKKTRDFYMEKVIDDVHSEEIGKTLESFSKYETIHDDFKKAIISFSSGDNEKSIKQCAISIEDYFCVILDKKGCKSLDSDYRLVSKKLSIPNDIDNRLSNLIAFIHHYRSRPLHGSKTKQEPSNYPLINQLIIGFTMTILNYLYNVFEK